MRSPIFDQVNHEKQSAQRWTLQSDKMLRVGFGPEALAAKGAMVAYQGQFDFAHESSGSMSNFLKKAVTSEGGQLMRVRGQGEVFFARSNSNVFTIDLEGDSITINTSSLLAFDASLDWRITSIGNAGMLAGGLFNLTVSGHGTVGISSDGPPMILDCSVQPTFVDPQAAVCWSSTLTPGLKNDFKLGSLIGRGSGESFQLAFHGPGFVVVQPSEGVAAGVGR
ncbi:AIM24 family protein [Gordonia sp. HNM0687]|uniref:AIM24 family protein n=1 Tax=Gordonia mangrovi TaxID=2665643 RepID=A0A6L7GNE5_9ACTN|nr:AIM24 family protein [Gordonia mangrovi]MXP20887.1 AIM24 family protein [Gordonia mangrovi]UVF78561.1 AIM24 family protein [Gordonia mangrovi]